MSKPFYALIIPTDAIGGGGGQPPGIWGGANQPFPGYGLPGNPPNLGGGGNPPGIWGGANEPFPGWGLPGNQPGVGFPGGPAFPTPPIVIPPEQPGQPPLVIWGPGDPRPMPPIELPGGGNPPPGGERVPIVEWHTAWTPETGWIIVGTPNVPAPAPSKK